MANNKFKNRKLALIFSAAFMAQAAHDTAIATGNLTGRHPMTTPAFHSNINFRTENRDCTGEFILIEQLTGKIARFTIGFDCTPKIAAGWYAMLKGISASPTGTPADEVQTLAFGGATLGTYKLRLDFEGLIGTSAAIAFDASNAVIQAALEEIRPIKKGNIVVTGTTSKTLTFAGHLAKANLPLFTIVDDTTTGGTGVTISAGTNGANKLHLITATTGDNPPEFSVIEGFDGDTGGIKKYKNLVMNTWTVQITRRGKASVTIEAFGDPNGEVLTGFSVPACITQTPTFAWQTRLKIGSEWITGDLRELTMTESNNIDVSEDALKFDDITVDQLERGDRTSSITALMLGSPTSDLYEFAEDENAAFAAFELAIGDPGERLTIFGPNTQFKLDDGLIEFVGTGNKSAFRLTGRPSPDGSGVLTRGEYHGAFATQFLLTA